LNDLFACLGLAQTRKLLTNFSKNSFYLLPEPLRLGEFLTNYCHNMKLIVEVFFFNSDSIYIRNQLFAFRFAFMKVHIL
jgi:hypothetical protein